MRQYCAGLTRGVLVVACLTLAAAAWAAPDYKSDGYQASESQPSAMLSINGHLLVASAGKATSYFIDPHSGGFEARSSANYPDGGLVAMAQCSGELVLASGGSLYTFGVDRTTGAVTARQSSRHAGGSSAALALVSGHLVVAGAGVVQAWMVEGGTGRLTPQQNATYADAGPVSIAPAGGHLVVCSGDRLTVYRVLAGSGQVAKLSEAPVAGAEGRLAIVRPAGGMLITAAATGKVAVYHLDPTGGQISPGLVVDLPGTGPIDLGYSTGNLILARGGLVTTAIVTGQNVRFRQQAPAPSTLRVALAQCNGNLIVGNAQELRSYLVDGSGTVTPRSQVAFGAAPAGKPLKLPELRAEVVVPAGFEPNWDPGSRTLSMKGGLNGLGILLTGTPGGADEAQLKQFADEFMGAIGEAMGVTNFTAKVEDTLEIGGRPALLRHTEGEKQGVKASFVFLFFSSPDMIYSAAYVVPTDQYDDYIDTFLRFLDNLNIDG